MKIESSDLFREVIELMEDLEKLSMFSVFHDIVDNFVDTSIEFSIFSIKTYMYDLNNIPVGYG